MTRSYLVVKDYGRFQHYKDRNPPWIKLYFELLSDYDFGCLQDASKMHLIGIWLLASRGDGRVPNDPQWIASRIGATDPVDVQALVTAGFLVVEQGASKPLAERKQNAEPEEEEEKQKTEAKASGAKRPQKKAKPGDERRQTEAQALVAHVVENGLHGVRPANYGNHVKRAQSMLDKAALDYWIEAANGMPLLYAFRDGKAWNVFDLGKNADKALAEWRSKRRSEKKEPDAERLYQILRYTVLPLVRDANPEFPGGLPSYEHTGQEIAREHYHTWNRVLRDEGLLTIEDARREAA
jgi:hypothetical protein